MVEEAFLNIVMEIHQQSRRIIEYVLNVKQLLHLHMKKNIDKCCSVWCTFIYKCMHNMYAI